MERRRRQGLPGAIALLIVLTVIVASLLFSRLILRSTRRDAYDYNSVELADNQSLQVVDDGFIYYDGASIAARSSKGQIKWSYLIGRDADFYGTDYGVAGWTEKKLTLIDPASGTTTFSGEMETEVLSARMGEKYTAVLLAPEHDSTIVLMEKGGRRVNSITLSSQTVIDYGFFSNGSLLWVMSLDTTGTAPSCTISTYRPGKERVGLIHDNEQLVYGVLFQSSYFCCPGETYLKVYDYTGKEERDRRGLVYGWYMAAQDDLMDDPMMAFVPTNQYDASVGMKDVRMIRAQLDQQVRMPYSCQSLICRGERVYGFSTEGYVCIARQGQLSAQAYRLPFAFDRVYGVTADDYAILGNGNTVYMLNLK